VISKQIGVNRYLTGCITLAIDVSNANFDIFKIYFLPMHVHLLKSVEKRLCVVEIGSWIKKFLRFVIKNVNYHRVINKTHFELDYISSVIHRSVIHDCQTEIPFKKNNLM
jgi:hypothetical protein